ncbi:MAG: LCP family protein [Clostridia bacterium]|nr:LCP family protein [Clostridia bacterium]
MKDNKNAVNHSSENTPATVLASEMRRKRVRRRRLSTGKIVAICIILVVYVLVLAAVSLVVFYKPKIDPSTKTYVEYITDTNGVVIETIIHEIEFDEQKSESYNILVLGCDRAAMLTDVFMLVNIDNLTHDITVMQIPRDTYVANHNGITIANSRVNALFSTYYYKYYRSGTSQDESYKKALTSVADDMERTLAVDIDFSVIMDLEGFRNIVDAVGGVEINVTRPLYYNDPDQGLYINIPAGNQVLNGEQAEGFVRFRKGYATADLGRQNAQKQFMAALLKKVKSSISISNVGEIADQIITYVDTDMSVADLVYFGQAILKCDLSNMNMFTMPGNLVSQYFVMNRAGVREKMTEYFYRYEGSIPDGMFDKDTIFNCPSNSSMSAMYYKPADQVYDDGMLNGEDAEDIWIN